MEEIKARFVNLLAHSTEDIKRGSYSYIRLSPDAEAVVRAEMEGWCVRESSRSRDEYDDYNDSSSGRGLRYLPVSKMTSASSSVYSTNGIRGDILVAAGHFVGIALLTKNESSSTWSKSQSIAYALLYTDGNVDGRPESSSCYTGESSSKENENFYSLCKKEN